MLEEATLDQITGVRDRQIRPAQVVGELVLDGLLPALRVTEEELITFGAAAAAGVQRILGVDVRAYQSHAGAA